MREPPRIEVEVYRTRADFDARVPGDRFIARSRHQAGREAANALWDLKPRLAGEGPWVAVRSRVPDGSWEACMFREVS